MPRREPLRRGGAGRVALRRNSARRPTRFAPAKPEAGEVPDQVRAPNRPEWPDPLNEEELRALEAGWSFVE